MLLIGYLTLILYTASLSLILMYCLMQFHLLYQYQKGHRMKAAIFNKQPLEDLPFVTIQLPVYNEYYVLSRLVDAIARFDYPKDKFEIQILDDSTDETVVIAIKKVEELQSKGFQIQRISRENRQGYKAGALKNGLQYAKGDLIAIFDADFVPSPDFLQKTVPYFQNPEVGVVQTRWAHINRDYSLLTKLQAFQLNVHFTIEQQGRESGNYLLQFNGTAGIWRKKTIEDAGGWEADTLTEDLDLSYRAQLKGWKINYLEEVESPAELPAEMSGLKSQQFRWMKGGAETARKILPRVWRSSLTPVQKMHATTHLLSSSVFISVFVLGVLSVPILFFTEPLGINLRIFSIFLLSTIAVVVVYFMGNLKTTWAKEPLLKTLMKFTILFPIFLALSMGLSLHNSVAVIQGFLGKKSAFIRTPKFNINTIADQFANKKYFSRKIPPTTYLEGILSIYFAGGIIAGLQMDNNTFILLHFLLSLGYGTICYYSVKHLRLKQTN